MIKGTFMRFGIIGCGMISSVHAGAVRAIDSAELVGACDMNIDRCRTFAAEYGIAAYDSYEALLSDKNIDAVCICTPSGSHAANAVQAAEAGKHIVIEKPMALTADSADEIISACRKNNVTGTVISQLRYSADVTKVRDAVNDGSFGKLVSCHLEMRYYRTQAYYDGSSWRGTWAMDGGGALMNQGIHGIDAMSYIMGGIASVSGVIKTICRRIEVEDTAAAAVCFKNGAVGTINGSVATYPGYPRRLVISGSLGSVELTEEIMTYSDLPAFTDHKLSDGSIGSGSSDPTNTPIYGHVRQLTDFIQAVKNNTKTRSDILDGRDTVKIIESIYKSSRTGMRVEI